jgi:hypothetical protein
LKADPKVIRTLTIEYEVPFALVAAGWVFSAVAAERLRRLHREHCRKCERAGVKPLLIGIRESAASV